MLRSRNRSTCLHSWSLYPEKECSSFNLFHLIPASCLNLILLVVSDVLPKTIWTNRVWPGSPFPSWLWWLKSFMALLDLTDRVIWEKVYFITDCTDNNEKQGWFNISITLFPNCAKSTKPIECMYKTIETNYTFFIQEENTDHCIYKQFPQLYNPIRFPIYYLPTKAIELR